MLPELGRGGTDTARAVVSHDEWIVLAHRDQATLEEWRAELTAAGCPILPSAAA